MFEINKQNLNESGEREKNVTLMLGAWTAYERALVAVASVGGMWDAVVIR